MGSFEQEHSTKKAVWYVNLDKKMEKFILDSDVFLPVDPELGPYGEWMPIEATLHSNNKKKEYEAVWELKPDSENIDLSMIARSAEKPELESEKTKEQRGDGKRRYFKNKLKLPDVGGQKYSVTCKKINNFKRNRDILTVDVETWRRGWFTIFWTDDSQKGLVNGLADEVTNSFKEAKIDLVHVPSSQALDWRHHFYSIVDSDDSGESLSSAFEKAMHGGKWPGLQREPFHLMIVLVKACVELSRVDFKLSLPAEGTASPWDPKEFGVAYDGSKATVTTPSPQYTFLTSDLIAQVAKVRGAYDVKKSVRSLKFQVEGEGPVNVSPDECDVTIPNPYKLIIGVPDKVRSAASKKKVTMEMTVEAGVTRFAGKNLGNKIVIQSHEISAKDGQIALTAQRAAKNLIHEIGHALNLATELSGLWKHPNFYRGHGGQGAHCGLNTREDDRGVYVYAGSGKMCVMYHQEHAQAGPGFCKDCLESLKFTRLRSTYLARGIRAGGWKLSD